MSEAVAAGASAGTTPAGSSSQGGQTNAQGKAGAGQPSGSGPGSKAAPGAVSGSTQPGKDAGKAPAKADAAAQAEAEELEEIKLGSAAGKVPKALAKVIKDLEKGFHGKSQEAAMTKKQFETFVNQAKSNPEWFFKETGIDPDQFSQARLAQKLQREMMSPEQRKAMEQEQELTRYRQADKERTEKEAKEKAERDFQETSAQVRREALQAIGKNEEIRDDPYLVARVFAVRGAADEKNLDWDWDKCVDYVGKEQQASWARRHSSLSPEQLEERLGPEALSKWREFDLKRVTDKSALARSQAISSRPDASSASTQNKKPMSEVEYREYWRKLAE